MTGTLIVTGSSRGIGAAVARLAARAGYDVCVTCHGDIEAAETVAADLRACGRQAMAYRLDVADPAAVERLFDETARTLGPVVGLVNNAGILGPSTRLEALEFDDMTRVFQTNVFGYFNCAKQAVRHMARGHGGRGGAIVNISSVVAKFGAPGEYVHYAATKGAVEVMTRGLATEVADQGIRVNAVRPGLTETTMFIVNGDTERIERIAPTIPMKRAGKPEEIAQAVLWLLSDEASYVTGATLDVGGGR